MFGVPLLREGTPIGVLIVMRRKVQPFSDKQIDLARLRLRPTRRVERAGLRRSLVGASRRSPQTDELCIVPST